MCSRLMGLRTESMVMTQHAFDIELRRGKRRRAERLPDSRLTDMVRRQRQRKVPVEPVQEPPKQRRARMDIVLRIERIQHMERRRGQWHELHQPDGPFRRHGVRIEIRFDFDHGLQEGRVKPVLRGRVGNECGDGFGRARERDMAHSRVDCDPAHRRHHHHQASGYHKRAEHAGDTLPTGIPFRLLHDRARTRAAWAGLVLPGLLIKASDEHGSALPIEPGLDAIAHMGRSIDPRVLIMGDTMFLPANIADQIRSPFHGLYLTD